MARIEQSIEVNVPIGMVYRQLSQFEEFPRFMKGVHSVHQLDADHLHWRAEKGGKEMEWDAEITENIPERCIAWRNTNGPRNEGKVTFEALDADKTRISLSMEADEAFLRHPQSEDGTALPEEEDLARFKKMVETQGGAAKHQAQAWMPPVDIEQHEDHVHICADLPGVSREDVGVDIVQGRLTIAGERRSGGGPQVQVRRRAECRYGHFYREIPLPEGSDPDSVQARLHDGVLDITVRIAGGTHPHHVEVRE